MMKSAKLCAQFKQFEQEAYAMGFTNAAIGAMVRSSYHADVQAKDVIGT